MTPRDSQRVRRDFFLGHCPWFFSHLQTPRRRLVHRYLPVGIFCMSVLLRYQIQLAVNNGQMRTSELALEALRCANNGPLRTLSKPIISPCTQGNDAAEVNDWLISERLYGQSNSPSQIATMALLRSLLMTILHNAAFGSPPANISKQFYECLAILVFCCIPTYSMGNQH